MKTFDGKLVKQNLHNNARKILLNLFKTHSILYTTTAWVRTTRVRKQCIGIRAWRRRHSGSRIPGMLKHTGNLRTRNILKISIQLLKIFLRSRTGTFDWQPKPVYFFAGSYNINICPQHASVLSWKTFSVRANFCTSLKIDSRFWQTILFSSRTELSNTATYGFHAFIYISVTRLSIQSFNWLQSYMPFGSKFCRHW